MDAELKSCFHKKVWEEVDRSRVPRDAKVLPLKWVYKIKTDSSNGKESELFKARITAMGNFQRRRTESRAARDQIAMEHPLRDHWRWLEL